MSLLSKTPEYSLKIENAVVRVTGTNRGIGRTFAREFDLRVFLDRPWWNH
jgi:hypothetical protein